MGFWDSSQTTKASGDVKPMDRPDEFSRMFNTFMSEYLPRYKDTLQTAYDEEAASRQAYIDKSEEALGGHSQLLSDLIDKQVSGEAVGPYGADIDKLLAADPRVDKLFGERTGVSFGGGDPMEFITGPQQRLLTSLLANQSTNLSTLTEAQRQGLTDIAGMSGMKAESDIAPAQLAHETFTPSNQPQISYLQDLWDKIQPMESLRYGFPSQAQTSTTTGTPSSAGKLNWLGNAATLGKEIWDWF